MKWNNRFLPFLAGTFFVFMLLCAQAQNTDSIQFQKSVETARNFYHISLSPEPGLYDGIEYIPYDHLLHDGDPYFLSQKLVPGDLTYNGMEYNNVIMFYDLVYDKLVITASGIPYYIQLNSNYLSEFRILNHRVVRLEPDSSDRNVIDAGFYEVLYNGHVQVLKRTVKTINELVTREVERYITQTEKYYLKKGNRYFQVGTESSVLKVLNDKQTELRLFIRKNKIRIKKDKDNSFARIAACYDSLVL